MAVSFVVALDGTFVVYIDSDDRDVFSWMKKIISPTIVMLLEKRNKS